MDPPACSTALVLESHRLHQQEVRSAYGDYVIATYFCDSDLLNRMSIENWALNRPPDRSRVSAIAASIRISERVQGIIALASLSGSLVCYDGNHRRLALSRLDRSYRVLITVIWAATNDSIIDEYESLNKSVSVPLIYTSMQAESSDLDREQETILSKADRNLIGKFCSELCKKYPKFSSSSRACRSPHFNRDILADDLLDLCDGYADLLSVGQVIDLLWKANSAYGNSMYKFRKESLSTQTQDKCSTDGLWLFCKGRTIDRQYLERVRKSNP